MPKRVTTNAPWLLYLASTAAVLATAALVGLIQAWIGVPTAILLYLLPIIFAASSWGRGPAVLAAVLSVMLQNVLFVEPVGALTIDHPPDAISLALLLFTALATAQLADSARRGAEAEREAAVIRRSDELKTALLRAVSHELRTPVASIKASASGLRQTDATYTEEDRAELLAAIEEDSDRLDRLVTNLLDASRLDAGVMTPRLAPNELHELLDAVVPPLQSQFPERRITVEMPADPPALACDFAQIQHVLRNLVENALVHTSPDATVRIRAERGEGELRVIVSDTGPGIPPGDRERLFRPFERGGTPAHGSGLGLTIVRGFVAAHGGRVWIEDEPGGGTRVVVTLPIWESAP